MQEAYGMPMTTLGQGGSIPLCNVFADTYPDAEIILHGRRRSRRPSSTRRTRASTRARSRAMALAEALFLQRYASSRE